MSFTKIAMFYGCLCLMNIVNGQGPPNITVASPLSWIHVTKQDDPSFASQIISAASPAALDAINAVLPYSVIVTNNGSTPLVGLAVRFNVNTGPRVVTHDFFYQSFGQPGRFVVPPGQSRLFTPFKTTNALAAGAAHVSGAGGAAPLSSASESAILRELASAVAIHVSVDLVVAPDGRYAGPDESHTVRQLTYFVDAYRMMRDDCLSRIRRGDSDAALMAWLNVVSSQQVFRDRESFSHRYITAQRQNAAMWLTYLKAGKRSELEAYLSKTTPELAYNPVISLKGGLQ